MKPVVSDIPGGMTIGKTDDSDCPYLVTNFEYYRALPVKFLSKNNIIGSIYTDKPIDIELVDKPECVESSKWLVFADGKLGPLPEHYVVIGSPKNYPSHTKIFSGTFTIERYESNLFFTYTLSYCMMDDCSYVGINDVLIANETHRRLIFTNPIVVRFERQYGL